jgi:hypothetical protein
VSREYSNGEQGACEWFTRNTEQEARRLHAAMIAEPRRYGWKPESEPHSTGYGWTFKARRIA